MAEKNPSDAAWLGLEGRVCVVTGGGSGIGAETARRLAQAGATVAVLDRNESGAREVATQITNRGGRAIGLAVDVSRSPSVADAAVRVQQTFGPCQVLINNAAVLSGGALLDLDLDRWNQLISVNLTGALVCTQIFGRQMVEAGRSGSMVHVASIAGHCPMPDGGAYSVSKAGVKMLSRQLSVELAPHGIRSNVVSPALVRTPLSELAYQDPAIARQRARMVPAGRVCELEELTATILFLASDRASYISGQDILVDGGLSQTLMTFIPRPGHERLDEGGQP